ncbi:hypothetical protein M514_06730 [Trichuris suis]|uniref:Uncharacterized protein n=1 Tax=Trichuris suis TaxID=68888 RepID=A0A085NKE0_9BILA|nr:hypothetical protein M513_06730 [Trichuris suis]KFD69936.1 hypothetical protein M514_06730 [Trichuris suis]
MTSCTWTISLVPREGPLIRMLQSAILLKMKLTHLDNCGPLFR